MIFFQYVEIFQVNFSTIKFIFTSVLKIKSMILYKVSGATDHISSEQKQQKYYPRICNRQKINLREIAGLISEQCSFSTPDVIGVLESLINNIPDLLMQNYSVELEHFGIFSLHAKAEASETEKEANAKKIKELKIAFRPHIDMKRKLAKASFQKARLKKK